MRRFSALLISIWLGLHIGFGCIAAPTIFARLETLPNGKVLAGTIAGTLFHFVNLFGIVAWLIIFFIAKSDNQRMTYRKSRVPLWTGLLLVLLGTNELLITPVIAALRDQRSNWLHDIIGGRFGLWHGTSYILYFIAAIIGLGLCIRLLRLDQPYR
ncbi:DUF4149 domain-containing protein [Wielerella bovis]|uniref:DUF4149 domain-containing protein n=1 Tax=Wielerella bovis TaxID=2917790 RepID=UPI002019F86E|nr:DUF4149 domain-containing protein [Wielerella bovis]ULJ59785.1 DUF4149 domain-containing protein [Wielerella bovis]ULJ64218.1 DUF4149 domain-containing protein [Wielerella bovis]ULJ67865.1 DUF4149 domain-containing protein [Wielerella bovis]